MLTKRIVFYPYKLYSESCKDMVLALREHASKVFSVYPDRNYIRRGDDVIINWGNSKAPNWDATGILNKPESVAIAVNKLDSLAKLQEAGIRTVPFTTDPDEASKWNEIVERHMLRAHSGAGIRFSTPDTMQPAKLYTQFLAGAEEYRVHVFRGQVIDYSKKFKREGDRLIFTNDEKIKNAETGWEFLRGIKRREGIQKYSIAAVEALGLDFGAVDALRWQGHTYILEVGTAPGLSPRGIELYTKAILEYAA
jgi:hypothetical protein